MSELPKTYCDKANGCMLCDMPFCVGKPEHGTAAEPTTVGELLEFLKQFPKGVKVTYDYGIGLNVEFLEVTESLDFH